MPIASSTRWSQQCKHPVENCPVASYSARIDSASNTTKEFLYLQLQRCFEKHNSPCQLASYNVQLLALKTTQNTNSTSTQCGSKLCFFPPCWGPCPSVAYRLKHLQTHSYNALAKFNRCINSFVFIFLYPWWLGCIIADRCQSQQDNNAPPARMPEKRRYIQLLGHLHDDATPSAEAPTAAIVPPWQTKESLYGRTE